MKDFNMDDYSALKVLPLLRGLREVSSFVLIALNLQLYSLPENLTR